MNQTEQAAYTLTRQRIVNQIDNIVAQGGSDSTLKRLRRFGNAFSWYPEFYPQILEGIDGMSDKQLMSALRTEDGFMKLMAPVKGLPIHHKIANRTGGDIALRTPTDTFLDVRKMIYDKYGGFPGNSAWNLGAQGAIDERMHQGRYGAKGTVFEESRGLGMAPTEELPIAHGKGTKDIGIKLGQDPALIRSQADEIFQALDPFIEPQVAKFTEIVENPVTVAQRKVIQEGIDPAAFDVGRTPEQTTAVRKAAEATGLDIKFASAFDFSNAGVKLGFKGLGALLPAVGVPLDILEAKEKTERAEKTKAPIDQLQAGIAQVTAATAPIPEPISQTINFVGGMVNFAIDAVRMPAKPVTEEDLEFSTL